MDLYSPGGQRDSKRMIILLLLDVEIGMKSACSVVEKLWKLPHPNTLPMLEYKGLCLTISVTL